MKTILIVDDEPLIAMALEAALTDEGYNVSTAANGRQGLDRLSEDPRPDLVLLDMMMPVMNGFAVLAQMADQPDLCSIPVIILSSLPKEAITSIPPNVVTVVRKPCSFLDLLVTIRTVFSEPPPPPD